MVFALRATSLCICVQALASCHINRCFVISLAAASPADFADSTARNPRRVQPSALGRYSGPWPAGQSHPPHVGAFRDLPRELASHLRLYVLSRSGLIFSIGE